MIVLANVFKPSVCHLLFWLLAASGCDGSETTSTNASARAIGALCTRVAQCSDTAATAEFMQQCQLATGALSSVLVDPEAFGTCVDTLSCNTLSNEASIQACVDLDPTTIHCNEDSLLACTNAGLCRAIDCREACSTIGTTYLDCGLNAQYGYDTCQCTSS